jgi:FkbM family methyltransferase
MSSEGNLDVLLRKHFFPDLGFKGVFVDVGAAGPVYLSNSFSFRELGWKVISIEPNPNFCAEHRKLGHEVLEYACSSEDRDDVAFTIVDQHDLEYMGGKVSYESFSSLGMPDSYAQRYDRTNHVKRTTTEISVKVRKLDTILAQHEPDIRHIDIVSVDVEGWELQVIEGLSLEIFQPKVIVLENLEDEARYRAFMSERSYALRGRIGVNDIYLRL